MVAAMQLWVKYGPKTLLESSYWDPRTKADYPIIMELDDLLLDLVSQALAPHWRRPSAQELAAHSLFQPVSSGKACKSQQFNCCVSAHTCEHRLQV